MVTFITGVTDNSHRPGSFIEEESIEMVDKFPSATDMLDGKGLIRFENATFFEVNIVDGGFIIGSNFSLMHISWLLALGLILGEDAECIVGSKQ